MQATISVPLDEFDALRSRIRDLELSVEKAKAEAEAAKLIDPAGRVAAMASVMADATAVIRFAVSNLDPETIRRWPYQELVRFAKALVDAPGIEGRDAISMELQNFAKDCESWEKYRIEEG